MMSQSGLQTDARVQDRPDLRSAAMIIDNNLHDEDVESMKFLCQGLLVGSKLKRIDTALEVTSLLQSANLVTENDYFLLAELLQYIGRVDVLERIGYDAAEVMFQRHQRSSKIHPFFLLLFKLAEEMTDEDVNKAAFCYGKVPRSQLQKLSSGMDLFTVMVQHQAIRPEDAEILITIFSSLERRDLVEQVSRYVESGGQSVMADLEQSFMRSMSLRGVNYGSAGPQVRPQKGSGDGLGPSMHDIDIRGQELPIPCPASGHTSLANGPPSECRADPSAPPLSLPSMCQSDPSLPAPHTDRAPQDLLEAHTNRAPQDQSQVDRMSTETAALEGYDNYVIPWKVLDILTKKIPAGYWPEFSYRLGVPLTTSEQGSERTSPFHYLTVLKRWLELPETRAMDPERIKVFLVRALHDAGPTLMAQEISAELNFDYRAAVQESMSSQESAYDINDTASSASAAHVSMEVAMNQPGSMGGAGNAQVAPVTRRMELLSLHLNPIPFYQMDRILRGICIIINNRDFYKDPSRSDAKQMISREGTDVDRDKLIATFQKLDFDVISYENCTDTDMVQIMQRMVFEDHTNYDCFVCCILTHGVQGSLYGTNGLTVPIRDMTGPLRAQSCPSLAGKPKLFFMQACQGREKQEGHGNDMQMDSDMVADGPSELIPNESDFLLGYATVPGFVSYRSKTRGSWYITKLTECLNKYAYDHDILDILTLVNFEVGKGDALIDGGLFKQSPAPMYSLRKKLIFRRPQ